MIDWTTNSFYWWFRGIPWKQDWGSSGAAAAEVWCPLLQDRWARLPQHCHCRAGGILPQGLSQAGREDFSLSPQHANRPEIILVFCRLNQSSFLPSLCVMFWWTLLCLGRRLLFLICIIKSVVSLDKKFFCELHRCQLLLKCMTFILCVCSQETKWADFSFCSCGFAKLAGHILSTPDL